MQISSKIIALPVTAEFQYGHGVTYCYKGNFLYEYKTNCLAVAQ